MVQLDTTVDNKAQCMCLACWITEAIYTNPECVIFIAFPLQQWLHECTSVLHYTYIACLDVFLSVLFITLSVANTV